MSTLADRIDTLAEAAFWAGEDLDAITDAIMAAWFEAMSTRYSSDEIIAALHTYAADLSRQTYH